MNNLAEKYRPTTFDDIRGSDVVVDMLEVMAERKDIPNCLMFTGGGGVGKTTAARVLATHLNGGEVDSTSYIELDAASNNGIEDIRNIQEMIRYHHNGSWRVVVIDEAHGLSNAAFNALLKVLENPPTQTTFILVTTRPDVIPDTVQSRAMIFRFSNLTMQEIAIRLGEISKEESLKIPPKTIIRVAEVSDGSLRNGIVLLQQLALHPKPTVDVVNTLVGRGINFDGFMFSLISGSVSQFRASVEDMFNQSYDVQTMTTELYKSVKKFFDLGEISTSQFLRCVRSVWDMRNIKVSNDHVARTQMEAGLFSMFLESFWDGTEVELKEGDRPITKEDAENILGGM